MKSTRVDVENAYGKPTTAHDSDGWVSLDYEDLGIAFSFDPKGAMKQINVHRPEKE